MEKYLDLSNQRFGKLIAIRKVQPHITKGGRYVTMWECQCDCGKVVSVSSQKLRKGHTTSCGCNKKNNKGGRFDDLTGDRFGKLVVMRYLKEEERERKRKCWLCRCDCGTIKEFGADKLKSGNSVSCGCAKAERIENLNKKYEHINKRLYSVYSAMKERCYNPENDEYHNYGSRGITVCPEWLKSFDNFAEWSLKNGYKENAPRGECTIDRINNDKGYSPDNCRWVTNKEQQNNRRNHVFIEYHGKTYTMSQLAQKLNIPYRYFRRKYRENGLLVEQIISCYAALK